jgi:transglutaminase-like putative cysteine protease
MSVNEHGRRVVLAATLVVSCAAVPPRASQERAAEVSDASTAAAPTPHPGGLDEGFARMFIGTYPVTVRGGDASTGEAAAPNSPLRITLEVGTRYDAGFAEIAKRTGGRVDASGAFTFVHSRYPGSRDLVMPRYRAASFFIDFDEPAVGTVRAQVAHAEGRPPSMEALTLFVRGYIVKKDMQRGLDIASRVAQSREGDCTEHAVLLAALARAFGLAARMVLGIALLEWHGHESAFGHAWVEHQLGGEWKPADAALPPELAVRYVPMHVVDDEGPAFERHLLGAMHTMSSVKAIVLDAG